MASPRRGSQPRGGRRGAATLPIFDLLDERPQRSRCVWPLAVEHAMEFPVCIDVETATARIPCRRAGERMAIDGEGAQRLELAVNGDGFRRGVCMLDDRRQRRLGGFAR